MITIAISAVTAGGKTTTVNMLAKVLPNARTLHFDDYNFEGEVNDFYRWVLDGADYPFAYCHKTIKDYIDKAFFINTPLDVALARRILRDMKNATADEIRKDLDIYLKYARIAYVQMHKDIIPSSDYVIDGMLRTEEIVEEILKAMALP